MNKIIKPEDHLPAIQYDDPFAEIAAELSFPTLLDYTKGDWNIKEEPVPLGTEFLALLGQLRRGYINSTKTGRQFW